MNRNEVINEFVADINFRNKWQAMIDDGTLARMLKYAECHRYPFNDSAIEHDNHHIQSRRDGGNCAWNKLSELLLSMPFDDKYAAVDKAENEDGYTKSQHLTQARTTFHKRR